MYVYIYIYIYIIRSFVFWKTIFITLFFYPQLSHKVYIYIYSYVSFCM